ncbi:enoyl-CoA hydratase/isomerase family protein [Rhodovibrionaceae bacterium A322]
MSDNILLQQDGAIVQVIINRPEKRNAFNLETWRQLGEVVEEVNRREDVGCLILRGAGGRAFAAGADISEFEQNRYSAEQAAAYSAVMHPALQAVEQSPHPTLALIEGACAGGGLELACLCDLRLCNESAGFGIPINRIGHVLPYEAMLPLVRLVGRAVVLEILLEGRIFKAREAYEKGLVNRILPDESFEEEAMKTARRIAEGAPLAARWHKSFSRRAEDPTPLTPEERLAPFASCDTADYREGVRAFLAKEKPSFSGS